LVVERKLQLFVELVEHVLVERKLAFEGKMIQIAKLVILLLMQREYMALVERKIKLEGKLAVEGKMIQIVKLIILFLMLGENMTLFER
jgi:hypothetical protein